MITIKKDFYNYLKQIKNFNTVKKLEKKFIHHGKCNVYTHSRNVAYLSFKYAKKLERIFNIKFNYTNLVAGAMLHDLFLYDWHGSVHRLHGYTHPKLASYNARKMCNINHEVDEIIISHMWPLTLFHFPKSREAFLVCIVDKIEAVYETFNR